MSSVKRRIIIEEYIGGGFGILEYGKPDIMGLMNEDEVLKYLRINKLEKTNDKSI